MSTLEVTDLADADLKDYIPCEITWLLASGYRPRCNAPSAFRVRSTCCNRLRFVCAPCTAAIRAGMVTCGECGEPLTNWSLI